MGFKCSPQIIGLTRQDHPKGKHRANGKAIAMELGKERISHSVTLDRSRSYLNEYEGCESGIECWNDIVKEANEYRSHYIDKNGKEVSRKLKKDAVVAFALVINPPSDVCVNWSAKQYKKFIDDMLDVLAKIEPDIFRRENYMMSSTHRDEGMYHGEDPHDHKLGICKDSEGNFCGNKIDTMLLRTINERLPGMMRKKGWDMDDFDTTAWERLKRDKKYRKEREEVWENSGQNLNKYIKQKQVERNERNYKREINLRRQATLLTDKETDLKRKEDKWAANKEEREQTLEMEIALKRKSAEKTIHAETQKAVKSAKEKVLVGYQLLEDERNQVITDAVRINQTIEAMALNSEDEYEKWLQEKFPDFYRLNKIHFEEFKSSLRDAVVTPDVPVQSESELFKDVQEEADHLEQVNEDYKALQKREAVVKAESAHQKQAQPEIVRRQVSDMEGTCQIDRTNKQVVIPDNGRSL